MADPVAGRISRVRLSGGLVLAVLLFNAAVIAFLVAFFSDSTIVVLVTLLVVGGVILALASLANTFFVRATGARHLQEGEYAWLEPMVEKLATTASITTPDVLIADQAHMNAYAVGSGDRAKIVFFSGLLMRLSEREVQAVAAHEIGHIANADTALVVWTWAILRWVLLVKIAAIAAAIFVFEFSKILLGIFNGMGIIGVIVGLTLGLMGFLFAGFLWVSAQGWALLASVIDLSLCRQREFLADATGASIDGEPEILASALAKISGGPSMETGAGTVGSLCIASPAIASRWWEDFLATHPSADRRIDALLKLPAGRTYEKQSGEARPGSFAILFPLGSLVVIVLVALLIPQFV